MFTKKLEEDDILGDYDNCNVVKLMCGCKQLPYPTLRVVHVLIHV